MRFPRGLWLLVTTFGGTEFLSNVFFWEETCPQRLQMGDKSWITAQPCSQTVAYIRVTWESPYCTLLGPTPHPELLLPWVYGGPKNLHSYRVARWYSCCRPGEATGAHWSVVCPYPVRMLSCVLQTQFHLKQASRLSPFPQPHMFCWCQSTWREMLNYRHCWAAKTWIPYLPASDSWKQIKFQCSGEFYKGVIFTQHYSHWRAKY